MIVSISSSIISFLIHNNTIQYYSNYLYNIFLVEFYNTFLTYTILIQITIPIKLLIQYFPTLSNIGKNPRRKTETRGFFPMLEVLEATKQQQKQSGGRDSDKLSRT